MVNKYSAVQLKIKPKCSYASDLGNINWYKVIKKEIILGFNPRSIGV